MSVLERSELEASPLADLHAIADQLGIDGFRRDPGRAGRGLRAGWSRGATPRRGRRRPPRGGARRASGEPFGAHAHTPGGRFRAPRRR